MFRPFQVLFWHDKAVASKWVSCLLTLINNTIFFIQAESSHENKRRDLLHYPITTDHIQL